MLLSILEIKCSSLNFPICSSALPDPFCALWAIIPLPRECGGIQGIVVQQIKMFSCSSHYYLSVWLKNTQQKKRDNATLEVMFFT